MSSDLQSGNKMKDDAFFYSQFKSDASLKSDASSNNTSKFWILGVLLLLGGIVAGISYFDKKEDPQQNESQKIDNNVSNKDSSNSNKDLTDSKKLVPPSSLPPLPTLSKDPDFDPDDPSYIEDQQQDAVAILVNHWYAQTKGMRYAKLDDQKDYGYHNVSTVGAFRVFRSADKPFAINVSNPKPTNRPEWVWQHLLIDPKTIPVEGIYVHPSYENILIAMPDNYLELNLTMSDPQPTINSAELFGKLSPVSGNVCESQDKFNDAVAYAIWKYEQKNSTFFYVILALWIVLAVWAVRLVQTQQWQGADRTVRLCLAIAFPPLYILAHYLNSYAH